MSIATKLINKLKRRRKFFGPKRGFRTADKADLKDEVLADSPRALDLARGQQRRLNSNFGKELLASPKKAALEDLVEVDVVVNIDDSATLTFSGTVIADLGIQPNDLITFLTGDLKGYSLQVVILDSSTEITTEIAPISFTSQNNIKIKVKLSGLSTSFS